MTLTPDPNPYPSVPHRTLKLSSMTTFSDGRSNMNTATRFDKSITMIMVRVMVRVRVMVMVMVMVMVRGHGQG